MGNENVAVKFLGEDYNGPMEILDSYVKADSVINNPEYKTILVSVSGGADSDDMVRIIHDVDYDHKAIYAFVNTGLEHRKTLAQIDYLQNLYDIEIKTVRPDLPIPLAVKKWGEPFISKQVSEAIGSLQSHGFKFDDASYEEMIEMGCSESYVKWWHNMYKQRPGCEHLPKMFNINFHKYLKPFLQANPPQFKISKHCCDESKKKPSKKLIKEFNADVVCLGVRRAEGQQRAKAYSKCFITKSNVHEYLPILWWDNDCKKYFEDMMGIQHSALYYPPYSFARVGCLGCGYNLKLEEDLEKIRVNDPELYKAAITVFKNSIEYTKLYKEYVKEMKNKDK